jgi:hypothetical protein
MERGCWRFMREGRCKVEEEERKLTVASTAWVNRELIVRRVVATRSTEKIDVVYE